MESLNKIPVDIPRRQIEGERSEDHNHSQREAPSECYETVCWGCGLRLILPSPVPVFRCGWCGAISSCDVQAKKPAGRCSGCSRAFNCVLVTIIITLIVVIICGGVWAVFPVICPKVDFWFFVHLAVTAFLSFNTLLNYCVAAFMRAGPPAQVSWGSVECVGNGGLAGYQFCTLCCKPKPPRAHHCRACRACVVEMDHHCPFVSLIKDYAEELFDIIPTCFSLWCSTSCVTTGEGPAYLGVLVPGIPLPPTAPSEIGNCVGAANIRPFILFLFFAVLSNVYVLAMSMLAIVKMWQALAVGEEEIWGVVSSKQVVVVAATYLQALLGSSTSSSMRAIGLLYLVAVSLSVTIGVGLLLHQQVRQLYDGQTFIETLQHENGVVKGIMPSRRGWNNLHQVFGHEHPIFWILPKLYRSANGKAHDK